MSSLVLDLAPAYREQGRHARSQIGGLLFYLYVPVLFAYLYYTIQPVYVPLPSCCICATHYTVNDSWVFEAENATCSSDQSCVAYVQSKLEAVCSKALSYEPTIAPDLWVSVQNIGCWGHVPGDSCSSDCIDLSSSWLAQKDYTGPLNRAEARYRCGGDYAGLCDIKVAYLDQDKKLFGHGLCQYPSLTTILTRIGSAMGLFNGILITLRSNIRSLHRRVMANEVKAPSGDWLSFAKGAGITLTFNYFGFAVLALAEGIPHRMRYGSQIAASLLLLFISSPLAVYVMYILRDLWGPMLLILSIRGVAKLIMLRTLYTMIRLDLRLYQKKRMEERQDLTLQASLFNVGPEELVGLTATTSGEDGLAQPASPTSDQCGSLPRGVYHRKRMEERQDLTLQASLFNVARKNWSPASPTSDQCGSRSRRGSLGQDHDSFPRLPLPPYKTQGGVSFATLIALKENHWANFFGGMMTTIVPIAILPSLGKRYSGMKEGGYVGTCLLALATAWSILSALGMWESDLSLDFPVNVNDALSHAQLITSVKESAYVLFTNVIMLLLLYKFIYFLQFRPVTRLLSKRQFGTKFHYRFGLILSLLPTFVVAIGVFIFLYSLAYSDIPKDDASCEVSRWILVAPSVCLVPGILLYFWATYERMRWGAMSAVGVQFLLMGLLLWVLSFYYCFSNVYSHMLAWGLECVGMTATSSPPPPPYEDDDHYDAAAVDDDDDEDDKAKRYSRQTIN
ncbi:uncharacterized protein ACA1_288680 [Acanthamoeba castellanii str. Neff]|uniref:Transmembrane protein n=1 Tax=Acanthamoeba castellanii (strain ATCC 30010 / Neff) TaxID=1257118 RepID=L8HIW2_ACACF|nr:uncharacterized protein ACA1_288680 [Acanthamoeba castellanii str. Neff]ELR25147.1 hypothetical protein ACA1_288680 [Acanthamoeba castellanii str. Neff]